MICFSIPPGGLGVLSLLPEEKVKVQAYAAKFGGDIEKGIKALADEIIHFKN